MIAVSDPVANLGDGQKHIVEWKRHDDGYMAITVDGKSLIGAADMKIHTPFEGVSIINRGGHYSIPRIVIHGPSR